MENFNINQINWQQVLVAICLLVVLYYFFVHKREKYSTGYRDSRFRNSRGRLLAESEEAY